MLTALLLAAQSGTGSAHVLPFPADLAGRDPAIGAVLLEPRAELFGELLHVDDLRLLGAPLPSGPVDLALERIDLARLRLGVRVDGLARPELLDSLDLSVWNGHVEGDDDSEVVLSFSRYGTRGWIKTAGVLWHLMPRPGEGERWDLSVIQLIDERALNALGVSESRNCAVDTDALPLRPAPELDGGRRAGLPTAVPKGAICTGYECGIAIETDYQLFQVFGDLAAETAYVVSLLASVSGRYQEQIDTTLTYPYLQFYTSPADPWSAQDGGGDCGDVLNEFAGAWSGNLPAGARLGSLISGASLGCGIAAVGVLCDTSQQSTFSVCGNIKGNTPLPVQVGPFNWDWVVFAHETGHNFNSLHTHSYCPPLDECPPPQYWGQCQSQQACTSQGTIMSYCHLCGAGMTNITTYFHPQVQANMKAHASACLPAYVPIDAAGQPTTLGPSVAAPVSVIVNGTPTVGVELLWRYDGGAFESTPMVNQGAGVWTAALPPAACTDSPEWKFAFTDSTCGAFESQLFTGKVGLETLVYADDFESSGGWVVGAPGDDASTGIWERVDPVGTSAQPSLDHTQGGTDCYVTGQHSGGGAGSNDIDDGHTTLTSPPLDLSGGDALVSYWRWYSNSAGGAPSSDVLRVDVSSNGGQSWVNAETVGPAGPDTIGGWKYHEFAVSSFVPTGPDVRVRFVAADEGQGSLVEAAIDDLRIVRVACLHCQAELGSGGPGVAALSVCGDPLWSGGTADLSVSGLAPSTGLWLGFAFQINPTPVLAGTFLPFPPVVVLSYTANSQGEVHQLIDGGVPVPHVVYVQGVWIDALLPGGVGFTNAVAVDLLP